MTAEDGRRVVRCYSQDGEDRVDYDVTALAMPEALREPLIGALVGRTAPGAGLTSPHSSRKSYHALMGFDRYLTGLKAVPQSAAEVTPEHFEGY